MKNKIEEIKKAIDAGAYFAALTLSLTIPDICGQIEYPDCKSIGKRYSKWYDKYVKPTYCNPDGDNPPNLFDGKMCYKLRCAILHSGNFDLKDKEMLGVDKIKLHVNKTKGIHNICNSYYKIGSENIIDLDAYGICYCIWLGVQQYYIDHKNKEDFEKYDSVILDIGWTDENFDSLFT